MKSKFWKLYKKELVSARVFPLIFTGAIVLWQVFLVSKRNVLPSEAIVALSWLPLVVLPFWVMWNSFNSFRHEWNGNTIYLLLSLPLQGWKISLTKLLAVLSEFTFYTLVIICGNLLFFKPEISLIIIIKVLPIETTLSNIISLGVKVYTLLYWFPIATLGVLIQFASLVGRLVERFQGLLSAWVFFLSLWLVSRWTMLTSGAFKWVPDLNFTVLTTQNGISAQQTLSVDTAPIIATLVMVVIIFITGSWLVEHELEV